VDLLFGTTLSSFEGEETVLSGPGSKDAALAVTGERSWRAAGRGPCGTLAGGMVHHQAISPAAVWARVAARR